MRVILLTNFIPPYRISLYKELANTFSELKILVSTPMERNRAWQADWQNLDVEVQKNISLQNKWHHPAGFSENITIHIPLDTYSKLRCFDPDWIISAELGVRTIFSVLYRIAHPNSRLVIWTTLSEETEMGRGILRAILRKWLLAKGDLVFVNGESGKKYTIKMGVLVSKIVTIPYTIDSTKFDSIDVKNHFQNKHRLLFSGQLIPRKGVLEFCKNFSAWLQEVNDKNDWEIQFLGDGPLKAEILKTEFPKEVKLTFLGNVPYSDLPLYYSNVGALVFPTLADEWGIVVNEAMAAGLPILGSLSSQAVQELVIDCENGWVFHPNNYDEIKTALNRYTQSNEKLITTMGIISKEKIKNLSPKIVAEKITQGIKKLS